MIFGCACSSESKASSLNDKISCLMFNAFNVSWNNTTPFFVSAILSCILADASINNVNVASNDLLKSCFCKTIYIDRR